MKINLEVGDPEFDRMSPGSFADAIIAAVYKFETNSDMAVVYIDEIKDHLSAYVLNERIRERITELTNKGNN